MLYLFVKNTAMSFLFLFVIQVITLAQIKKISEPNIVSQSDIYLDESGNRYSTIVTFKFKKQVMDLPSGVTSTSVDEITLPDVKNVMITLGRKYGNYNIEKAVPTAVWGDTIRINKRNGKVVSIKDMSQIFELKFSKLVPVDSIADELKNLSSIEYAQGPVPAYLTISPNDPYYLDNSYRWSFDVINAEQAWNITQGSSNIYVSINDEFGTLGQIHEEISGKVFYRYNSSASGGHGTITSGVVGSTTNNGQDIASLGWNTSIMFHEIGDYRDVNDAVNRGADIINFSWVQFYDNPSLSIAIHNALIQGVVCVASAGNAEFTFPLVTYPAAYNFGSDGQVIAVSGTWLNNGIEEFIDGFNYSPGTDPINDPTNAFIDCSAPGANYRALSQVSTTGTEHVWVGTSISAPFVSALVALMLSVNNSLTPTQVYEIITKSVDKVGEYSYDANGWNQYMGYGRINAYNALLLTHAYSHKSMTNYATSVSGQRKIVKDASDNYHVVYMSGYEIFYQKVTSGTTWGTPIKISYDNGNNNYPSIAVGSTNQVMITWQRNNGTNYDVYFSMTTDGGTNWNNKYILASSISSSSPSPVITYNSTSQRKTVCYTTAVGIYSKHTNIPVPTQASNWTTAQATTNTDESPSLASSGNSGHNLFTYKSGSNIYYKYQNSDGTWQTTPTNISNMVPGASVNYTPTICGLASSGNVYLAWTRYDNSTGYPTNPRTFYTKNTSANGGWPYQYWGVTSGNQYSPTITALATNKIDLLYTTDYNILMYTRNNGSTWSSPVSKGSGAWYPSVSIGSTMANYVWTSGYNSPFTINIGSPVLSKEGESGTENYSRSIAIMNNPEEYLEVVLNKMYFKMKDGSIQRVDFLPADLEELKTKENFDLTTNNAWDLMKGIKNLTIPVGADELVFDYTVKGENIDKVIEGNLNQIELTLGLDIPIKVEKAEKIKSIAVNSGKITETKLQEIIPLSSLTAERGFDKVDLGLKVKSIVPKSTAFASLGHIFDFTNITAANETQANKTNDASGTITEELTTQNYPNPFNPTTLIKFTIKQSGKVTLKVYDVLGREVANLLNSYHESGSYEIPFDGSNLPSGIYFYNLTANGKSLTKKMMLLK